MKTIKVDLPEKLAVEIKNYVVFERKRTFCKSARMIFYLPIDNFKI